MWPIYAGLVANDSLILLDEAHCALPFLQTLQAVRRFRTWAHAPLARSFCPVVMSATPPPGSTDVFTDRSNECLDPGHPLGRRRLARKPARLHSVKNAAGRRATTVFATALAEAASELINEERRAIVVFANRVATAREAHRRLAAHHADRAVLVTGRMRPVDKDVVVQQRLKPLQSAQSAERSLAEPLIVVATQTLEVGADLDFDGLVTECASLDALRQRFGRLNRMGRPVEARAEILIRGDQAGTVTDKREEEERKRKAKVRKKDDPVYGSALAETWAWLDRCRNEDDEVDFGIAGLDPRLPEGDSLIALNAPAPDAPVMLPSHVDCWAQTAPRPHPSPDVAPFLHGPREGAADVQVSGYPAGGRHELLSVRLAESAPASLPGREDLRDLTLHLIASHHGHCRPFAPVVLDDQCVPVGIEWCGHRMQWSGPTALERLDSGVADRYWRLIRRYGWWGLAWLEALLRLADWRRSEWEETHDAEP